MGHAMDIDDDYEPQGDRPFAMVDEPESNPPLIRTYNENEIQRAKGLMELHGVQPCKKRCFVEEELDSEDEFEDVPTDSVFMADMLGHLHFEATYVSKRADGSGPSRNPRGPKPGPRKRKEGGGNADAAAPDDGVPNKVAKKPRGPKPGPRKRKEGGGNADAAAPADGVPNKVAKKLRGPKPGPRKRKAETSVSGEASAAQAIVPADAAPDAAGKKPRPAIADSNEIVDLVSDDDEDME